jgi:hypothetical protein
VRANTKTLLKISSAMIQQIKLLREWYSRIHARYERGEVQFHKDARSWRTFRTMEMSRFGRGGCREGFNLHGWSRMRDSRRMCIVSVAGCLPRYKGRECPKIGAAHKIPSPRKTYLPYDKSNHRHQPNLRQLNWFCHRSNHNNCSKH